MKVGDTVRLKSSDIHMTVRRYQRTSKKGHALVDVIYHDLNGVLQEYISLDEFLLVHVEIVDDDDDDDDDDLEDDYNDDDLEDDYNDDDGVDYIKDVEKRNAAIAYIQREGLEGLHHLTAKNILIGSHTCRESPIKVCVYPIDEASKDNCIFCGGSFDRKQNTGTD